MADSAVHEIPSVYEPSLFGTYSKKIGMWLFLLSDSLTFGALLYAYSYGRIGPRLSIPRASSMPRL
jgi:heme/copper-type cytochrome/quinol oxidase subunit 3